MVVIIFPLHPEQGFYSISFHVCGKGQLLRATCRCCCERLCLSITSYYHFSPMCLFFFKASASQAYWEEIYQKSNPQTRLNAQIKMEREIEKGGEEGRGGSVQFSLETNRIVGAVWRCSRASIESEFLLLNSIQRYHNLKRLLLPRGFRMKPSERDFWNARSHNCHLTTWDLSRPLFPDRQVVYIILPVPSPRPCWGENSSSDGLSSLAGAVKAGIKKFRMKSVKPSHSLMNKT